MTTPEGEIRVDVEADASGLADDVERDVRRQEHEFEAIGRDIGDSVADGMTDRIKSRIPGISERVSSEFSRRKIKADVDLDVDEGLIPDEIERAVGRALGPGGPIDRLNAGLGQAISSGIGAGFNVSGRGPLILLLLPLIGAIGALIGGAVQAVNGLIALLYTIPSLIGAIVLQVGVLFLVFQGLGKAIGEAFAAKTPKEFEKAIEHLAPPVQDFIRSLLPLRELFTDLKDLAQRNFFAAFGTILADFASFMRFNLVLAVDRLSTSFGNLFRSLVSFFGNPRFQEFFKGLIDSTDKWLQALSPALTQLLIGFTELGIAIKPFFDWFGTKVAQGIADFGKWLQGLSEDEEFLTWLEDMKDTLKTTAEFFGAVVSATKEFAKTLDAAGGRELIDQLIYLIREIEYFLEQDIGRRGLNALLGILLGLTYAFVILVGGFLSFLAIIHYGVDWLVNTAGPAIEEFFTEDIPAWFQDLIDFFTPSVDELRSTLTKPFTEAKNAIVTNFNEGIAFIKGIPDRIKEAFSSAKNWLIDAGKNIIQGLISGIREELGPLGFVLDLAAGIVGQRFPQSPAEVGPLSGKGDPLQSGRRIIQRLATGIQMETPSLATASSQAAGSIVFGPGSVQVGFEGAVPTPQQAMTTGVAAGQGIVSALSRRNTRLQIRTL